MSVEILEEDIAPSTMISIAIYNTDGEIVPCWWISIDGSGRKYYDMNEIKTIIETMPSIASQLQKLLDCLL